MWASCYAIPTMHRGDLLKEGTCRAELDLEMPTTQCSFGYLRPTGGDPCRLATVDPGITFGLD